MSGIAISGNWARKAAALEKAAEAGLIESAEKAVKLIQAEVVARCPVHTGAGRDWLASNKVLKQLHNPAYWQFGLKPGLLGDVYYLYFVEFGTKGYSSGEMRTYTLANGKVRSKKVKRDVPARPAQPFFRPGVDAARGRAKQIMIDGVKNAMSKAAELEAKYRREKAELSAGQPMAWTIAYNDQGSTATIVYRDASGEALRTRRLGSFDW